MSRSAKLLLTAPVLALSLGALLWLRRAPVDAVEAPSASPTTEAKAPAYSTLTRDFTVGREHLYAFRMTQATSSATVAPAKAGSPKVQEGALVFQVELRGALSMTPVAGDGASDASNRKVVRAAFEEALFHLRQDDKEVFSADARRDIERSLKEPSFVEMSPAGQVLAYHFPATVVPLARSLMRAAIASTQPTLPADGSFAWQTTEGDSGGEYQAVYHRTGGATLTRRKGQYSRLTSPKGLVPAATVDSMEVGGTSTFTLDKRGWVERMSGVETVSSSAEAANQVGSTRVVVSLDLVRVGEKASLVDSFLQGRQALARTVAAENDLAVSAAREVDQKLAKQERPATVLKRLEILGGRDAVARADGKDQLSAMVRLDPKAAEELARAVRGGLPPLTAGTVVGALASAGTEPAAVALAAISGDRSLSGDLRADATMALATSEDVTAESIVALRKAAESDVRDVRSAGALGMGAAAKGLAEKGQEGADELVTTLLERLDASTSQEERTTLFNAIGNSGDARVLSRAKAALAGDGPSVRGAAVMAVRHVKDQGADDVIASSLGTDPERSVRSQALLAMSFRTPALHVSALEAHLQREPLKSLRFASVSLLGKWRSVPGAAGVLLFVMKSDKDAEVRAAAEALLNG